MPTTSVQVRTQFFDYLFGRTNGYLCIACAPADFAATKLGMRETYFEWPRQRQEVGSFIERLSFKQNVWFCTSLLDTTKRTKANCLPGTIVWGDFDFNDPSTVSPKPSIVIQSSEGRFQYIWRLDATVAAETQEDFAKRVEYKNKNDERDPSKGGWDLTQLLRVPLTYNLKYENPPQVEIVSVSEDLLSPDVFEKLPRPGRNGDGGEYDDAPKNLPDVEEVLERYRLSLQRVQGFYELFYAEPAPGADWSRLLWRVINLCLEAGMDLVETFAISMQAACNKYERDNRPTRYLWRDVNKAAVLQKKVVFLHGPYAPLKMPQLVEAGELEELDGDFVSQYKDWAAEVTDAPLIYHEVSCFVLLSALMAASLKLEVSWGTVYPNLWALCLGESTLTRKSTAMELAKDLLEDVDEDVVIGGDGTAEGLLTALSQRPDRVSVFYRDEIAGFFSAMNKKDYLSDLKELLTELYGVPRRKTRLLKKDPVTIIRPYFIFFGGGIKDKIYTLVNDEYILSGFLPRFLVVSGDAALDKIRLTGPPNYYSSDKKIHVVNRIRDMHEWYSREVKTTVAGQEVDDRVNYSVHFSEEAWARANKLEKALNAAAIESPVTMYAAPTFSRMYVHILKLATLIAAAQATNTPDPSYRLHVSEQHVVHAASYMQKWGPSMIDLILNAGKSFTEKILDKVMTKVRDNPGIHRSIIVHQLRLTKKEADNIISTLEDRGLVAKIQDGRGFRLYPNI